LWGSSAWIRLYAGEWAKARDEFILAMRLSPLDPEIRFGQIGLANALIQLGEPEEALGLLRKAIATGHGENYAIPNLIHCLVVLGRVDAAKEVVGKVLGTNPNFTMANVRIRLAPFSNKEFCDQRLASFRAAGVPDG
jgi:adenylate cyclase